LALANNTLLLPHRAGSQEEEEEGMTWVPVQARVTAFLLNRIKRMVVHPRSYFEREKKNLYFEHFEF
jgi:hypothetical protein